MKMKCAEQTAGEINVGFSSRHERILINCIGYYDFDEPYGATHRKHGRKDYYLSYNHSGRMKVKSGQKIYEIDEGTVFIYKPFEEHYYGQADNKPISNYWVHFTGYGVDELLFSANLGEGNIYYVGVNNELPCLFESIIDELTRKSYNFKYMSASLLEQLILTVSRKLEEGRNEQSGKKDLRIGNSISFIHKNYNKKISVSDLANIAGLSPNRYSNTFKAVVGVSPMQYLIHFRLQKAKEFMSHTNLNIRQIASLTGFDNQLYFSRLFSKYEKLPPSNYKRRYYGNTKQYD